MTKRTPPKASTKTTKAAASDPSTSARPRIKVSHGGKTAEAAEKPRRRAPAPPPSRDTSPLPRPKRAHTAVKSSTSDAVKTALAVAEAALEKKASNVEIIDIVGKTDYADYLVLMSGGSDRHVRSLAESIQQHLRDKGVRPLSVEGLAASTWILIDFADVVVHVFQESARAVYDIDGLWLDADRVQVPDDEKKST